MKLYCSKSLFDLMTFGIFYVFNQLAQWIYCTLLARIRSWPSATTNKLHGAKLDRTGSQHPLSFELNHPKCADLGQHCNGQLYYLQSPFLQLKIIRKGAVK